MIPEAKGTHRGSGALDQSLGISASLSRVSISSKSWQPVRLLTYSTTTTPRIRLISLTLITDEVGWTPVQHRQKVMHTLYASYNSWRFIITIITIRLKKQLGNNHPALTNHWHPQQRSGSRSLRRSWAQSTSSRAVGMVAPKVLQLTPK